MHACIQAFNIESIDVYSDQSFYNQDNELPLPPLPDSFDNRVIELPLPPPPQSFNNEVIELPLPPSPQLFPNKFNELPLSLPQSFDNAANETLIAQTK
jgi:hypothetical protein